MNDKIRAIGAGVLVVVWLALSAFAWFSEPKQMSESERRPLAEKPELTQESLLDGSFME